MRSLLPLLLLLAAASVSKASCPEDWQEFRDKCYKRAEYHWSWHDAQDGCELLHTGATLASAHNLDQNAFLAEDVAQYAVAWLGLRQADTSSNWTWTDGSSFDFEYWLPPDEPTGDGERCGLVNCYVNGMWCARPCDGGIYEENFMCQLDA